MYRELIGNIEYLMTNRPQFGIIGLPEHSIKTHNDNLSTLMITYDIFNHADIKI